MLAVDPNAKFTAPAATLDPEAATWLQEYLAYSNGANFADIMTFHGYVSTSCPGTTCPEMVADQIDRVNKVISGFSSAQGKPLFDTEGDWGHSRHGYRSRSASFVRRALLPDADVEGRGEVLLVELGHFRRGRILR